MKAPHQEVTDRIVAEFQLETHVAMRAAGAEVAVALGLNTALRQLEAWGLLKGRAS